MKYVNAKGAHGSLKYATAGDDDLGPLSADAGKRPTLILIFSCEQGIQLG